MQKSLTSLKEKLGWFLLTVLVFVVPIVIFQQAPIAQDPHYHIFVDERLVWGVVNFFNVFSNLAFLLVGITGLHKIFIVRQLNLVAELKWSYVLLYLGLIFVAFGSAYYHFQPNNQTLLWDRLPMTISFMALMSVLVGEFLSTQFGRYLLMPLLLIGFTSVLYWYLGEQKNLGDLRFYLLVQFIPVLSIPIILSLFSSHYNNNTGYWWLLVAYVFAKLLENYDGEVFAILKVISGHSLKHMAAAFGMYLLLKNFEKRQIV